MGAAALRWAARNTVKTARKRVPESRRDRPA
ncbi:hypothetical protein GA0115252_132714 [Streptomyces sp. DfronAA-171]|nr:hypothetical protein GA0115252_132714 [Streptomyces sp. DfronAA-171]SCE34395.1 hypothetical protein GA0115246_114823 [Streptomyces sp. SolWspMP-sol7th]